MFVRQFLRACNKENTKAPHYWPFVRRGQQCGKCAHVMTALTNEIIQDFDRLRIESHSMGFLDHDYLIKFIIDLNNSLRPN